ncbi:hypothetical protein ACLOJK_007996 [Asimina triloba]
MAGWSWPVLLVLVWGRRVVHPAMPITSMDHVRAGSLKEMEDLTHHVLLTVGDEDGTWPDLDGVHQLVEAAVVLGSPVKMAVSCCCVGMGVIDRCEDANSGWWQWMVDAVNATADSSLEEDGEEPEAASLMLLPSDLDRRSDGYHRKRF